MRVASSNEKTRALVGDNLTFEQPERAQAECLRAQCNATLRVVGSLGAAQVKVHGVTHDGRWLGAATLEQREGSGIGTVQHSERLEAVVRTEPIIPEAARADAGPPHK